MDVPQLNLKYRKEPTCFAVKFRTLHHLQQAGKQFRAILSSNPRADIHFAWEELTSTVYVLINMHVSKIIPGTDKLKIVSRKEQINEYYTYRSYIQSEDIENKIAMIADRFGGKIEPVNRKRIVEMYTNIAIPNLQRMKDSWDQLDRSQLRSWLADYSWEQLFNEYIVAVERAQYPIFEEFFKAMLEKETTEEDIFFLETILFWTALTEGDFLMLELILEHSKYADGLVNIPLREEIQSWISEGNPESVRYIGLTPLMLACANGRDDIVNMCISYRADVNTHREGEENTTALMFAVNNFNGKCALLLLENKADVNAQSSNHWTSLMILCNRANVRKDRYKKEYFKRVFDVLMKYKADPNILPLNTKETPKTLCPDFFPPSRKSEVKKKKTKSKKGKSNR